SYTDKDWASPFFIPHCRMGPRPGNICGAPAVEQSRRRSRDQPRRSRTAVRRGWPPHGVLLERLERASGKGLRKWIKATPRQRLAYLTAVLQLPALHGRLFAAHFTHTTTYLPCVLTTITQAVTAGAAGQPARATILIDGLKKTVRQDVAAALRV